MKLLLPQLAGLLALSLTAAADVVGTTFTYQGRLNHNGAPADGSFDLKFELFDAAAEGNAVGVPIELAAQNLSQGLFAADLDFGGPVVFDGTAYWLTTSARVAGAAEYVPVPARTAIRPTPYAIHALSAATVKDGAITSNSLANGAVTGPKLSAGAVGLAQLNAPPNPNPGQLLAFDGNDLSWVNAADGGGGGGPWLLNGTSAFYSAGRVGIATSTPAHSLSIAGGPLWTSYSWSGAVELNNGSAIGWKTNAAGNRFGIGQTNSGLYFFRTTSDPGTTGSPAIYEMYINDQGNTVMTGGGPGFFTVGSPSGETGHSLQRDGGRADLRFNGTTLKLVAHAAAGPPPNSNGIVIDTAGSVGMGLLTPTAGYRLAVNGGVQFSAGGLGGTVQFGAPNGETGMTIAGAGRADLRFDGSVFKMLAGPAGGPPGNGNGIAVTTAGNVGIGTTLPAAKLDVAGDVLATRLVLRADPVATTNAAVLCGDAGVTNFVPYNTATNRPLDMIVRDASVRKLTITGGADLAEPFAMSHDGIEPGTVVVIDEKNPGKLKTSTRAYDKKVAGIVSGANGVQPGISMIQEDKLEAGENVALSGRVYVKADTSAGTIEPGDLLTTSAIAGRAMKAADHDQAQGAIIGKAMTSLNEGEGMVLVLVTLQ